MLVMVCDNSGGPFVVITVVLIVNKIYTQDSHIASARTLLSYYIKAKDKKMDKEAEELDVEISKGEILLLFAIRLATVTFCVT